MKTKLKITESQLKRIIESRKHNYTEPKEEVVSDIDQLDDEDKTEVEVDEVDETLVNESIERIKNNFKRFL